MGNNNPFITIGIASYNYANYLDRAFDAIKRQSFRDFEVLYADDGSTDDSVTIINRIIADNPDMNIRLIAGENLGVMGNKQRILDNALGKYIMLCDADDWMDDDCLQTLAEAAQESDADRVVSEIRNVGKDGKTLYIQKIPSNASKWCEVLHHGALYKKSLIVDNRICFSDIVPDDFCFIEDFNVFAQKTVFVHKAVYNWYIHADSTGLRGGMGSVWKGRGLLQSILTKAAEVKQKLNDPDDIAQLQAECIKCYYYHLFRYTNTLDRKERKQHYNAMHGLMLKYEPDYLDNPYMRLFHSSPFRFRLHVALSLFTIAEKMRSISLLMSLSSLIAI